MKRMKKFAVVALALMLMATQLVLASAEGLGNRTQDVKAKYSGGAAEPEVYSVDVTWGFHHCVRHSFRRFARRP